MRKIGKRGKINQKARDKIAEICEYTGLEYCEAKLDGCMQQAHGPAHRHGRVWYYDKPDDWLWNIAQWIASCQKCHMTIDQKMSKEECEEFFVKMRGKDQYR